MDVRRRLLDVCPYRWDNGTVGSPIYVLIPLGDPTTTPADAWGMLFFIIDEAWISLLPPIHAINKWKIYFLVAWWSLGGGVTGFTEFLQAQLSP